VRQRGHVVIEYDLIKVKKRGVLILILDDVLLKGQRKTWKMHCFISR
jgi:hypothetical protein